MVGAVLLGAVFRIGGRFKTLTTKTLKRRKILPMGGVSIN